MGRKVYHSIHNVSSRPACEHPIQLIGLFKRAHNSPRPYGKHTGKPIKGFPYFDPEEYISCPYFDPSRAKLRANVKRKTLNLVSLKVIQKLQNEFHYAVAITERCAGFRISYALAEKMLAAYLAGEGYLYFSANIQNVYWMFAYRTAVHSLYKQQIYNADLQQIIIDNIENAYINPTSQRLDQNPNGKYYSVTFSYTDYKCQSLGDDMVESMQLNIQNKEQELIFQKEIRFDVKDIQNLPHCLNASTSRKEKLLKISHKLIGAKFPDLDALIEKQELQLESGSIG